MRDIRPDIIERLENIKKDRDRLGHELTQLDNQEVMFHDLLRAENERAKRRGTGVGELREGNYSPITKLALEAMADGSPRTLEYLKKIAVRRGLRSASLGRSLHGALISLKRQGKVEQVDTGIWKLAQKSGAPAERAGAS